MDHERYVTDLRSELDELERCLQMGEVTAAAELARSWQDSLLSIVNEHTPVAEGGNHPDVMWCTTCTTAWPCRTIRFAIGEQLEAV